MKDWGMGKMGRGRGWEGVKELGTGERLGDGENGKGKRLGRGKGFRDR